MTDSKKEKGKKKRGRASMFFFLAVTEKQHGDAWHRGHSNREAWRFEAPRQAGGLAPDSPVDHLGNHMEIKEGHSNNLYDPAALASSALP